MHQLFSSSFWHAAVGATPGGFLHSAPPDVARSLARLRRNRKTLKRLAADRIATSGWHTSCQRDAGLKEVAPVGNVSSVVCRKGVKGKEWDENTPAITECVSPASDQHQMPLTRTRMRFYRQEASRLTLSVLSAASCDSWVDSRSSDCLFAATPHPGAFWPPAACYVQRRLRLPALLLLWPGVAQPPSPS